MILVNLADTLTLSKQDIEVHSRIGSLKSNFVGNKPFFS